jgi:hypothetical protein
LAALLALLLAATATAAAGIPANATMRAPISGLRSVHRGML